MTTLTISLPESLRDFIDQQVKTRGYGNTSEYLRNLVRHDQEQQAQRKLEALLLEGIESGGDDVEATAAFWQDLKAEAIELVKKRRIHS